MGFAAEFDQWLSRLLLEFIGQNLVILAQSLAPVVVLLATLYLMIFGVLLLTGRIEAPLLESFKRLAVIAGIFAVAIHLWLYQSVIVATFFDAPGELAAQFVGAFEPVTIVDEIIFSGGDIAALLIQKGGLFSDNFAYYLTGIFVYIVVAGTAIYVLFLLTLSRVGLAVLLALGPFFLALLFFKSTTRFCESWLAQLSNYALVAILTVLIAALMLHVLSTEATRALGQGGEIQIADAMRVSLAAGLTCLILRQVMPLASALASGVALQSYSVLSRALGWSGFGAARNVTQFSRGFAMDGESTRWDPIPRKAGFFIKTKLKGAVTARRRNVIRHLDDPKAWDVLP